MNIYQKIKSVMEDVQYLCKDSKVEFGSTKYRALSEEKVTSVIRASMMKNGLVMYPTDQTVAKEGQITTVNTKYIMVNTDDPTEQITIASSGQGADSQDKGSGKAMTYAFKYALLRTFMIPTGEDPDKISSEELDAKLSDAYEKKEEAINASAMDDALRKTIYNLGKGDLKRINEFIVKLFGEGRNLGDLNTEELTRTKVALAKAVAK